MGNTQIVVNGETPFFVSKRCFTIGASTTGYTLQTSVTDAAAGFADYSDSAIPANKIHELPLVASGKYWRLKDNVGKVIVTF